MPIIRVNNLKKKFGKGDGMVSALRGINLEIEEGEMVAIMGKSGSGKSTLLNILGGLMEKDEGEYLFQNEELNLSKSRYLVSFRRDKVGYIVQHFALIQDLTVFKNVEMPLRYQKCKSKERKERVNAILEQVGLSDKKKSYPDELSGGQQQRVAIARALVKEPSVVLADEPTGALDKDTGKDIMNLFHQMHQKGKTVLIVTHDPDVARQCDRIIEISDGKIL